MGFFWGPLLAATLIEHSALAHWKELGLDVRAGLGVLGAEEAIKPTRDLSRQKAGPLPGGSSELEKAIVVEPVSSGREAGEPAHLHALPARKGSSLAEQSSRATGNTCQHPEAWTLKYRNGSHHKKELKFIHVTMTGGEKLEQLGCEHGLWWGRYFTSAGWWHKAFRHYSQELRSKYDWFLVARNPFDRILDEFYNPWGGAGDEGEKMSKVEFNAYLKNAIRHSGRDMKFNLDGDHYTRECDYLSDDPDVLQHVVHHENMAEELDDLMIDYNLPIRWSFAPPKKRKFNVRDMDNELVALIQRVYAMDFSKFGYSRNPMKAKLYFPEADLHLSLSSRDKVLLRDNTCLRDLPLTSAFYVNMDKDLRKKQVQIRELTKRFAESGVEFSRWPGVTPPIDYAITMYDAEPGENNGTIMAHAGRMLAHSDLMEHIGYIAGDAELFLVLEDGRLPVADFTAKMAEVMKDPDMPCSVDLVRLDCDTKGATQQGDLWGEYPSCNNGNGIVPYPCYCGGVGSYVVSKQGALKMLQFYLEEKGRADCSLARASEGKWKNLSTICLNYGLTEAIPANAGSAKGSAPRRASKDNRVGIMKTDAAGKKRVEKGNSAFAPEESQAAGGLTKPIPANADSLQSSAHKRVKNDKNVENVNKGADGNSKRVAKEDDVLTSTSHEAEIRVGTPSATNPKNSSLTLTYKAGEHVIVSMHGVMDTV